MSKLTINLIKIVNLRDGGDDDEVDPYVQFSLKQQHHGGPALFRQNQDFGTQRSTVKSNDRNPVYQNETFIFDDLPSSLKNMELTIRVLDKDDNSRDDKLGKTTIHLEKLKPELEPIPQTYRFKINNRLVKKDSYIFVNLSFGEVVIDDDV
jgi:Ca2+-dependent lipid-binding protein